MPDPRLQLTARDLFYAATALRAEARRAEQQAGDPAFVACRALFGGAARTYDELARKFTQIARAIQGE